jgi:hypothetical protein
MRGSDYIPMCQTGTWQGPMDQDPTVAVLKRWDRLWSARSRLDVPDLPDRTGTPNLILAVYCKVNDSRWPPPEATPAPAAHSLPWRRHDWPAPGTTPKRKAHSRMMQNRIGDAIKLIRRSLPQIQRLIALAKAHGGQWHFQWWWAIPVVQAAIPEHQGRPAPRGSQWITRRSLWGRDHDGFQNPTPVASFYPTFWSNSFPRARIGWRDGESTSTRQVFMPRPWH